MFLTDEDLQKLTQRTRTSARRKVLNALGIEHGVRPDGSLVVLQSAVEEVLGGKLNHRKPRKQEPNWSAL